jgi:hypothetical protein
MEQSEVLLGQAELLLLREVGNKLELALCLCERAHLALACGSVEHRSLHEAEQAATSLGVTPQSELGKAIARVRRAQEMFEAGRPLFRGECWEDIPAGLRQRLIRTGRAGEPFALLEAGSAGERGEQRERPRAMRADPRQKQRRPNAAPPG